ncbi:hypothetical protein, partial [Leptospira interrogans]|uniref:hypothetical protein n=1 Tax=Leptospira interrogans TaxID=173 RepID=UPI0015EE6D1E
TALGDVTDSFFGAKREIDGSSKPAISKRRGGGIGGLGGLLPVRLSPGERVDVGGKSYVVPGQPEPRDSFLTALPPEAVVWTFDGQARLAMGEDPSSVLKTQAPHFREGGIVKPKVVGGSTSGRGVANQSIEE